MHSADSVCAVPPRRRRLAVGRRPQTREARSAGEGRRHRAYDNENISYGAMSMTRLDQWPARRTAEISAYAAGARARIRGLIISDSIHVQGSKLEALGAGLRNSS